MLQGRAQLPDVLECERIEEEDGSVRRSWAPDRAGARGPALHTPRVQAGGAACVGDGEQDVGIGQARLAQSAGMVFLGGARDGSPRAFSRERRNGSRTTIAANTAIARSGGPSCRVNSMARRAFPRRTCDAGGPIGSMSVNSCTRMESGCGRT